MVVSIQYLRGLAAVLVVLVHLQEQLKRAGHSIGLINYGSAGVDIFFVISGFVMWHTSQNHHRTFDFYYRRIIRIVPLYWLLTSIMVIMLIIVPSAVRSGKLDWTHIIASYLFIPMAHPVATDSMFPTLVPGWTLNYEMFFYAIFGLALFLPRNLRLPALVLAFGALAAASLVVPRGLNAGAFYTDPIILEFLLGVILGWLCDRGVALDRRWGALLIVAGVAWIVVQVDAHRLIRNGVGAALLVYGAVLIEMRRDVPRNASLLLLGDASYSLYLIHPLAMSIAAQIISRLVDISSVGGAIVYSIGALMISLATAIVLFRLVEIPALRVLRKVGPKALPPSGATRPPEAARN